MIFNRFMSSSKKTVISGKHLKLLEFLHRKSLEEISNLHPLMPRKLSKGSLDPSKVFDHLQHDHPTSTLASGAQNPGAYREVGYQATTQAWRSGIWWGWWGWWSTWREFREWVVHWWWGSWDKLPAINFGVFSQVLHMLSMDCTVWYGCSLFRIATEVRCWLQAVRQQRLAIPWVHVHVGVEDVYSLHQLTVKEMCFCIGGVIYNMHNKDIPYSCKPFIS